MPETNPKRRSSTVHSQWPADKIIAPSAQRMSTTSSYVPRVHPHKVGQRIQEEFRNQTCQRREEDDCSVSCRCRSCWQTLSAIGWANSSHSRELFAPHPTSCVPREIRTENEGVVDQTGVEPF